MNEDDTDIPQQQQTSHKPGGEPKIKVTIACSIIMGDCMEFYV